MPLPVVAVLVEAPAPAADSLHEERLAESAPPDPSDAVRWARWLEGSLSAAGARIAAAQRDMVARGILDTDGKLVPGELPADMLPGSESSVATG